MLITRQSRLEQLADFKIVGEAASLILKAEAPKRHAARVAAALAAATAAAGGDSTIQAAILASDVIGLGGPLGVSGLSTARHPALEKLGKGRKQATDGPAWSAAILEALKALGPLTLAPDPWGIVASLGDDEPTLVPDSALPLPWARAIARLGLLVLSGWTGRAVEMREAGIRFAGAPATWADLVNNAEAELLTQDHSE